MTGRLDGLGGAGGWSVADWAGQLDRFRVEEVTALLRSPDDLVGRLRADPELLVAVARADVRSHLVRWLSPVEDWQHDPVGSGPVGDAAAGVEWSYGGRHDLDLAFNGTRATGRAVTVRGYTRFAAHDGRLAVRRYVDWAGAFAQIGLTLNWRAPMPASRPVADAPARPSPRG